ncbi:hypothetical protein BDW69DRAFT_188379 [Aspergillus filifer]
MAESPQWYFAYGSNMGANVFQKRRKINPLTAEAAVIATHTLCFNVMGVPYTDPAMGGIRLAKAGDVPVHGVAYLLTPDDMRRVIVSEGGGIAYTTGFLTATLQKDSSKVTVTALLARHHISIEHERLPSERYLVSFRLIQSLDTGRERAIVARALSKEPYGSAHIQTVTNPPLPHRKMAF